VAASHILLVDADAAAAKVIADTLEAVGHMVTTLADGDEAFRHASEHELIVIDALEGARTAEELCGEIRATPALAAIPVLCIAQSEDVEARIAFLEAGADDVLAKPFDSRELEARVEALVLRFQRSRELAPSTGAGKGEARAVRRSIAVFSPKGGVGATTIATNIAAVLATRKPDSVVLIDLDLQFGQVATQLDLEPTLTLADLIRDDAAMSEPELLRTYTTRHDSGLHVLAGPNDFAQAASVRPEDVARILKTILGTFDSVVIDAGSTLDDISRTVFEHVEQVVFPILPEVPALKALHRLLDQLSQTGTVAAKATYVLNSTYARELVRRRDVEDALGARVAAHLPYDPFVYLKAVNEGVPVVIGAPKTPAAASLTALAELVFPNGVAPAEAQPDVRRRGLLGGLRRRG
jgi:pilus assembly protein CpaE